LRDEAHMVPQLANAMRALSYPPEKLDIKFVVESRSQPTLKAVISELRDPRFELVIVPDQVPRTKPKALNYALPLARGEFVVIYDAEDIPQHDQLRRAASIFYDQPGLDCLQAELVIDNANENWLSALYSGEYSGLFGLQLPALARWKMPLPLGGTSNHFRLKSLREVGGWDAFNVTEDADLGIRLTRLRYRTGTFTSRTYEEAPITVGAWLSQRTRWMKGWMQTFIVHNRHPVQFLKDMGWRNFLVFQAFVGGMIISAPLHTVFLSVLLMRIVLGQETGLFPHEIWGYIQSGILIAGYGSALVVSSMGLRRLGLSRLIWYQLLLPFYWALNSWAAILAVYELLTRPYFWAKTEHGLTRFTRGAGMDDGRHPKSQDP
jgi:cellulose synthase/poly-beta-1,6-N-acetylglucosamine synthase-like glycosyltransferase